jgi:hypothetical protein
MQSALTAKQAEKIMKKYGDKITKRLENMNILDYDPEYDGDEDWTKMSDEELELHLMDIDVEKLKKAGKQIRGQQAK